MVKLYYIKDVDPIKKHVTEEKLKHNYSFGLLGPINYALDGKTITSQDNFKSDNFTSDTASFVSNMDYNSGNDWYETINWASSTMYFIDIYATSISGIGDWEINGCKMITLDVGIWRLYYDDSSTWGKARSKVMQTLYVGTGTTPTGARLNSTYVTGVTALKTSDANDVGKQAYYIELLGTFSTQDTSGGSGRNCYRIDTFDDTESNTYAQIWSICYGTNVTSAIMQMPSGTTVNSGGDEYGTDTDSERADNPANTRIQCNANGCWYNVPLQAYSRGIVLCKGTMTKGTIVNNGFSITREVFDTQFQYYPAFELSDFDDVNGYIITDLRTLSGNETSVIIKSLHSLTSGTLKTEVSFDNQAHWIEVTEKELAKIHYLGTFLFVKFTIQRGDNSEIDYISDYAMYYG